MKKYSMLIEIDSLNSPIKNKIELEFQCDDMQFVDKTHFIVNGIPFTLKDTVDSCPMIFGVNRR